jgi:hypothetical protein
MNEEITQNDVPEYAAFEEQKSNDAPEMNIEINHCTNELRALLHKTLRRV